MHPFFHPYRSQEDREGTSSAPADPECRWRERGRGFGRGFGRGGRGGRGFWHHHLHHGGPIPHGPLAEDVVGTSDVNEEVDTPSHCHRKRMIARFLKHITVPDGSSVTQGQALTKTWRFRNDSDTPWPANCEIVPVGGDTHVTTTEVVAIRGGVTPGQEIDVSVPIQAPDRSGVYQAYFRLREVNGKKFGQRVWVNFVVPASSSDGEDFITIQTHSDTATAEYNQALKQLEDMGFVDSVRNTEVLTRFHGNVERAVNHLARNPQA